MRAKRKLKRTQINWPNGESPAYKAQRLYQERKQALEAIRRRSLESFSEVVRVDSNQFRMDVLND